MPLNIRRIIANMGYAFFVTLGGLFAGAGIGQIDVPSQAIVTLSLIAAGIQAAIVFFSELGRD